MRDTYFSLINEVEDLKFDDYQNELLGRRDAGAVGSRNIIRLLEGPLSKKCNIDFNTKKIQEKPYINSFMKMIDDNKETLVNILNKKFLLDPL